MKKERADHLLVQQGWAEDQEKAKRFIMAGKVYTKEEKQVLTAGEKWPENTELYIKGQELKYVSRGGLKLEKAINTFDIDVHGKTVLDIGSSTGGFTDAALQNGAALVYALDVGTNQLAWKLRQDDRVIVMEQTNFRHSKKEDFKKGPPSFSSIDVSFISLKLILPVLKTILVENGEVAALIKPQFEAAREDVGEKGIITDPTIHKEVLEDVLDFAEKEGFSIQGLTTSPITGGKGNKEFLAYFKLDDNSSINYLSEIDKVLAEITN
jgi:23S rRNA (cytidine1920-2'-O)/16S rRNA (cytidine1409-2'-O)-methyltransferase